MHYAKATLLALHPMFIYRLYWGLVPQTYCRIGAIYRSSGSRVSGNELAVIDPGPVCRPEASQPKCENG